jgi:hypothetical protein
MEKVMPFDKLKLADMTATSDEYIDIEGIAERCDVCKRTAERLIEKYAKKLKKSRQRQGRKILYLWSDILYYAKVHMEIEKENAPSGAIQRAYRKQMIKDRDAEIERLKDEIERLKQTKVN